MELLEGLHGCLLGGFLGTVWAQRKKKGVMRLA